mgnify:CR=1 FL=1
MIYPYSCRQGHSWEVTKPLSAIDDDECCPDCSEVGGRQIARSNVDSSAGDWNRVEYNPGLGQWTKSWKHGRQIAKSKGLVEIGDEPLESMNKHFDKVREDKAKQRWADADRIKAYD